MTVFVQTPAALPEDTLSKTSSSDADSRMKLREKVLNCEVYGQSLNMPETRV